MLLYKSFAMGIKWGYKNLRVVNKKAFKPNMVDYCMNNKRAGYKLLSLSALFLVLFIIMLVYYNTFNDLDEFANNLQVHNNFLTSVSTIIHYVFDTIPVVIFLLIVALFLWIKKYKKEAILVAGLGIANGLILLILKNTAERIRPVNQLISETGFSFPSGHAASSVILFGMISFLVWKRVKSKILKILTIIASVILMLIIGLSRVYLNVHWLSDVLAGYFLGLFLLFLGIYLFEGV